MDHSIAPSDIGQGFSIRSPGNGFSDLKAEKLWFPAKLDPASLSASSTSAVRARIIDLSNSASARSTAIMSFPCGAVLRWDDFAVAIASMRGPGAKVVALA